MTLPTVDPSAEGPDPDEAEVPADPDDDDPDLPLYEPEAVPVDPDAPSTTEAY